MESTVLTEEQRNDLLRTAAGRNRHDRCLFAFEDPGYIPGTTSGIVLLLFAVPAWVSCPSQSHLDAGAVEMYHLGSRRLYAAHDLFLMAHQCDP